MTIFTRFFKRAAPLTLEQKIANLEGKSNDELLSILNDDSESALKHAAILRLSFCSKLVEIATSTPPHPLEAHARKRIGELLDANQVSLDALAKSVANQEHLITLSGYSSTAGLALIHQFDDETLLLGIAKTAATTSIRQAAADKITSQDALIELQKVAKNKDKNVYKIVKAKLDVFKAERAEQEKHNEAARAICHQAQLLTKRDLDEIFFARKSQIEAAWQPFAGTVPADIEDEFSAAMALSQQKIDAQQQAIAEQKAKLVAEQEAKSDIHATINMVRQHIAQLFAGAIIPVDAHTALTEAQQKHLSAIEKAHANGLNTEKESQLFKDLTQHAQDLAKKIEANGTLQHLLDELKQAQDAGSEQVKKTLQNILTHTKALADKELPEVVSHAKTALKEWSTAAKQKASDLRSATDESFELIRRGNFAINNGQVRRAKAIFSDLEKRLAKLESIPSSLQNKYEEFKNSLAALGDWHQFAVTPKKEALIEQMQQMLDATLHPKDLADKIKSLQEQWRELSRGGQNDDSTLWEKFQELSQKAYEPCKIYFEEQNKILDDNLQNRQQLVEQLQTYLNDYDWDNAKWGDVEKTLRIAREAWQSYWPVPRKPNKPLQEQFDKIADGVYQNLNAEYERNRIKKQAIVDRAEKALSLENSSEAIDLAKNLQAQWQSIGRSKAKADQDLWRQFRQHCDAIFDRRKQESAAEQDEREAAKTKAESILTKLEHILALGGEAFTQARAETEELIQEFKQLSELPRAHYKTINQAFTRTLERLHEKAEREKDQAKWVVWGQVLHTHHLVCELERARLSGQDGKPLAERIETALDTAKKWPSDSVAAFEQRLANTAPAPTSDSTLALKLLCVRSEIANNTDTPEGDKALRMQYQVEQLQQGIGAQNPNSQLTFESVIAQWLQVPAIDAHQYQELEQRLLKTWGVEVVISAQAEELADSID